VFRERVFEMIAISKRFALVLLLLVIPQVALAEAEKSSVSDEVMSIKEVMELAYNRELDLALKALNAVPRALHSSYDYKFANARLLTWAGRLSDAERYYTELLSTYPNDLDVKVSAGYFELFSGNLTFAKKLFSEVVDKQPAYIDAKDGLQRVNRIEQAELKKLKELERKQNSTARGQTNLQD